MGGQVKMEVLYQLSYRSDAYEVQKLYHAREEKAISNHRFG
jgi:hypothetical protein